MLNAKGHLIIQDGKVAQNEADRAIQKLADGDYTVLVMDNTPNKPLNNLKYLFGVVLKTISDELPNHPPVDALYRYFEELYAPIHVCNLPGIEKYEYFNLKGEKAKVMNDIIEDIIHYAKDQWGIDIMSKVDVKQPEAKEVWAGAYTDQWKEFLKSNNE